MLIYIQLYKTNVVIVINLLKKSYKLCQVIFIVSFVAKIFIATCYYISCLILKLVFKNLFINNTYQLPIIISRFIFYLLYFLKIYQTGYLNSL